MSWPWPSFGGFQFLPHEHAIYGTDIGWVTSASYNRQRPLGSNADVITALAIGSKERSFEINLTPARFDALYTMLNTRAVFTDWGRPRPDSRDAFLAELVPLEDVTGYVPSGIPQRKRRARISFVSA